MVVDATLQSDDTVDAALQYVKYAFKPGSAFAGTVQFIVSDVASGKTYTKSLQVRRGEEEGVFVYDGEPPGGIPIDCSVKVEKSTLLGILAGVIEAPAAFLLGQMSTDNSTVLSNFVSAFEFRKEKFEEFQQSLSKQEVPNTGTDVPEGTTTSTGDPISNVPNPIPPQNRELKQNLALGGLKLILAVRTMAKEVDAFVDRIKADPQVQKALIQLGEETAKIQATEGYQKIQASSTFNTLKYELEKASIGVSSITTRAVGKSLEVVENLTKTAYPTYVPTQIDLSVPLAHSPPPIVSSSPRRSSFWATNSLSYSPLPPSPLSSSPVASSPLSSSPNVQTIPLSHSPSNPPAVGSPAKTSFFQSFKSAVSSPTLSRMFSESKEEKEAKEKIAKEREREVKEREREAKEKEREAKERAVKEAKEREERQREEKRRQLQAKLEGLQKQNEETSRHIQEETRKRKEEIVKVQQKETVQDNTKVQDTKEDVQKDETSN